jgi:hypothetical protein
MRPVRHVRHVRPVGTYHRESPTFPVLTDHRAHRAQSYLWASLRAALAGYPLWLPQVPDPPGKVNSLPLGVATVHVRKGRSAVRQGTFVGPHHVTTTRALPTDVPPIGAHAAEGRRWASKARKAETATGR